MARNLGLAPVSANFKVNVAAPLDPRVAVDTKAELLLAATWPANGSDVYLYDGLVVAVNDEKALYMLVDSTKYSASDYSGWKRLDAGAAAQIEVVAGLTSTDDNKALAASQGKILDEKISALDSSVNSHLDASIGELETTIGDVSTNLKDLSDTVDEIDRDLDTLEGRVDTIDTSIGKLDTSIGELNTSLGNLKSELESTISTQLSSVYRVKGSCTYAELSGKSDKQRGDVWNVTDAHENVPAGTNYVWTGEEWDALAGIVDLSPYAKDASLADYVTQKSFDASAKSLDDRLKLVEGALGTGGESVEDMIEAAAAQIESKIGKTYVTNASLNTKLDEYVKTETYTTKIGEIDSSISGIKSTLDGLGTTYATKTDVSTLETKVDENTRLIGVANSSIGTLETSVGANTAAIEKLNGSEDTQGSVLQIVKDANYVKASALTVITSDIEQLKADVSTNQESISSLTSVIEGHTSKISALEQTLTWQGL